MGKREISLAQATREELPLKEGQLRSILVLPTRGFTRGRFLRPFTTLNLSVIEKNFEDGEEVSLESLKAKGIIKRKKPYPLKILANGEMTKKVSVQARCFTKSALEKLKRAGASIQKLER